MKGFTLLETVLAIALMVLMLAAIARFFVSFNTLYFYEGAARGAQTAAAATVGAVENVLFPADRILSSHTFSAGSYSSNATTLVVEIPSVDSSGNILPSDYDYAAIYLAGGTAYELVEKNAASARRAGTTALGPVASLSFSYDASDVTQAHQATVTVVSHATGGHATVSATLVETVRGRNLQP
ncbi:MAG: PulJ/GspJ family protein [Minisyncoccia bacterium]